MTTALDSTPEVPVKKKRPPRKKKKKKQEQQQQEQQQKQTQEKETQPDSKPKQSILETKAGQALHHSKANNDSKQEQVSENELQQEIKSNQQKDHTPNTGESQSKDHCISPATKEADNNVKPIETKAKSTAWETTVKKPKKIPPEPAWETVQKPKKASVAAWETVTRKEGPSTLNKSYVKGNTNFVTQSMMGLKKPAPSQSNRPAAGWGPKSLNPVPPTRSNSGRVLGVSGASDWRNQPLKRNTSGSARNLGFHSASSSGPGWPSLGGASAKVDKTTTNDWPSLGGSPSVKTTKSSAPQSVISKGAWTTKNTPSRTTKTNAWGSDK